MNNPRLRCRHYRQRFDPNVEMRFRKDSNWSATQKFKAGDTVPEGLLSRGKMLRWWNAGLIELVKFDLDHPFAERKKKAKAPKVTTPVKETQEEEITKVAETKEAADQENAGEEADSTEKAESTQETVSPTPATPKAEDTPKATAKAKPKAKAKAKKTKGNKKNPAEQAAPWDK